MTSFKKITPKLIWDNVRSGDWITAERVHIAAIMAVIAYLGLLIFAVFFPSPFKTPNGEYLVLDFNSFWTAAKLALSGDTLTQYSTQEFLDLQVKWTEYSETTFAFFYPPTWLLYILPFGLVPQPISYFIFNLVGIAIVTLFGRAVFKSWLHGLMLCALPAAMNCLLHGQNGLLSAALLGGAMFALQHRKFVLAGIFVGLLSYKPQMGLIIPLALIFARHWQTFISASVTTLAVAAISLLAFGIDTWIGFFEQLPIASYVLRNDIVDWEKMTSIYAALRVYGLSDTIAWAIQSIAAFLMVVLLFFIWQPLPATNQDKPMSDNQIAVRATTLVAGGLLFTPFALAYDFAILLVPLAFLIKAGQKIGFLPYEKTILALIVIFSSVVARWAVSTGMPIAPLFPLALLWLAYRRHKLEQANNTETAVA